MLFPPYILMELLWVICGGYLAWRLCVAVLRVRWARHAYPQVPKPPTCAPGSWQDRCRGLLVGGALGDALNLPAESLPRWLAGLRYPGGPQMRRGIVRCSRRPGDISDDTQLTICVARSVDPVGDYQHKRFLSELAIWSYYRIGAGRASVKAALRARRGVDEPGDSQSQGNGVAIRVAPFAICCEHDEALTRLVEQNGRATHDNTVAVRAGVFVALLLKQCLRKPPGFLNDPARLRAAIEAIGRQCGFE